MRKSPFIFEVIGVVLIDSDVTFYLYEGRIRDVTFVISVKVVFSY